MPRKSSVRVLVLCASIFIVSALGAQSASADTITAGNQIFSGQQCFGSACVNPEVNTSGLIRVKMTNTPGVSMIQTNGGGFTAQTWDVAGNEANFFIRDVTGGSRLPLRIFPGAPTSALRVNTDGTVSTVGVMVEENAGNLTISPTPLDPSTVLAKLSGLEFTSFDLNSDTQNRLHFKPTPITFNTAFGLGSNTALANSDVASVALAGLQQLNTKVNALPQTPDSTTGLTAANAQIAALKKANKKMLKSLRSLSKKVKKLSKRR